jgi:aryl-alcohol dehydrogenase-like predicted oxidoreductase
MTSKHAEKDAEREGPRMYYRLLGNTGLQVSLFSLGTWASYGDKKQLTGKEGLEILKKCMCMARDAGVNFFDTAEEYGHPRGEAEKMLGKALCELKEKDSCKWRRSDLVISTKVQ